MKKNRNENKNIRTTYQNQASVEFLVFFSTKQKQTQTHTFNAGVHFGNIKRCSDCQEKKMHYLRTRTRTYAVVLNCVFSNSARARIASHNVLNELPFIPTILFFECLL